MREWQQGLIICKERTRDWRVWTVGLSGSRQTCVSAHTTKKAAQAALLRLQARDIEGVGSTPHNTNARGMKICEY